MVLLSIHPIVSIRPTCKTIRGTTGHSLPSLGSCSIPVCMCKSFPANCEFLILDSSPSKLNLKVFRRLRLKISLLTMRLTFASIFLTVPNLLTEWIELLSNRKLSGDLIFLKRHTIVFGPRESVLLQARTKNPLGKRTDYVWWILKLGHVYCNSAEDGRQNYMELWRLSTGFKQEVTMCHRRDKRHSLSIRPFKSIFKDWSKGCLFYAFQSVDSHKYPRSNSFYSTALQLYHCRPWWHWVSWRWRSRPCVLEELRDSRLWRLFERFIQFNVPLKQQKFAF